MASVAVVSSLSDARAAPLAIAKPYDYGALHAFDPNLLEAEPRQPPPPMLSLRDFLSSDEVLEGDQAQDKSIPLDMRLPLLPSELAWSVPGEESGQDESLRHVLRSIATIHRLGPEGGNRGRPGLVRGGDDDFELGIAQAILESHVSGAALRAAIDQTSSDGEVTTFSVFGIGEFVLDASAGSHAIALSEASGGQLVAFSPAFAPDQPIEEVPINLSRPRLSPMVMVLHWVLEWLTSPLGILIVTIAWFLLMLWAVVRSLARQRQKAVMIEAGRLRRRRRRIGRRAGTSRAMR